MDAAAAHARNADSKTALNQQSYTDRESLRSPENLQAMRAFMPEGVDPSTAIALHLSGKNPSIDNFAKGMVNFRKSGLTGEAAEAARGGNSVLMNQLSSIANGEPYEPYQLNETGRLDKGTGEYELTPGHMASVGQRNAAANASNAQAGANNALANQRQFLEVSPGASVVPVNELSGGRSSIMETLNALPGGEPAPNAAPQAASPVMRALQPVFTAPGGMDKTAARDAAKVNEAMRLYALSEEDAYALSRGWKRVIRDEVNGRTSIVNLATGQETQMGSSSSPAQDSHIG